MSSSIESAPGGRCFRREFGLDLEEELILASVACCSQGRHLLWLREAGANRHSDRQLRVNAQSCRANLASSPSTSHSDPRESSHKALRYAISQSFPPVATSDLHVRRLQATPHGKIMVDIPFASAENYRHLEVSPTGLGLSRAHVPAAGSHVPALHESLPQDQVSLCLGARETTRASAASPACKRRS